jgi:hypothetical protein
MPWKKKNGTLSCGWMESGVSSHDAILCKGLGGRHAINFTFDNSLKLLWCLNSFGENKGESNNKEKRNRGAAAPSNSALSDFLEHSPTGMSR